MGKETVSCPVSSKASSHSVFGYSGYIVCPPYSGLKDVRCGKICGKNDPECLGIKGSAAKSMASALPPPPTRPPQQGQGGSLFDLLHGLLNGKPVVVHGRNLLRH